MSEYGIFKNQKGKTLVFYPCPKNGNSSVKLFLAKHLNLDNNFLFISDKLPRYKQTKKDFDGKKNLINFLPTKQPFEKINANLKCCIIRDPVQRFVSAFRNRILYHRDVEFFDHDVDSILERLENNNFENLHFLPQNFFLLHNNQKYRLHLFRIDFFGQVLAKLPHVHCQRMLDTFSSHVCC